MIVEEVTGLLTFLKHLFGRRENAQPAAGEFARERSLPHRARMRSEVACLMVTHDIPEEAMPWLRRARELFGRLVVFVDSPRAKPSVQERANALASAVYTSESPLYFASDFRAMVNACESDWVLYLDFDEELSPEWDDESWRSLIRRAEFTHYLFPRRWILPNGNYITSAPWWPDLHLRLFRSDLATAFPTKLHEAVVVQGEGAVLRSLCIHHHVLWLTDRATREQKAQKYDSLFPGGALEHFYLYEDFPLQEAPVASPAKLNWEEEILSMPRLSTANARADIQLVEKTPGQVRRSTLFWIDVTLRNDTGMPICSAPPFQVGLSYHWRNAATNEVAVYDGLRTELLPPVAASQSVPIEMVVNSPPEPGKYVLHLTLVQEQNFWFEEVSEKFGCELTIEVS
jgi:hypothetical protein